MCSLCRVGCRNCHQASPTNAFGVRGGSLLCKFVMCVRIKMPNFTRPLYFLVMDNIFPVEVHEIYDLKGSYINRSSKELDSGECR